MTCCCFLIVIFCIVSPLLVLFYVIISCQACKKEKPVTPEKPQEKTPGQKLYNECVSDELPSSTIKYGIRYTPSLYKIRNHINKSTDKNIINIGSLSNSNINKSDETIIKNTSNDFIKNQPVFNFTKKNEILNTISNRSRANLKDHNKPKVDFMASNYTPKSYLNMAKNRQQINKGPYSHSDGRNIGDGVEFIPENWKKGVFEKEDLSDNILKDLS